MIDEEVIEDYESDCFPPVCPDCDHHMGWSGDFTLKECCYIDEDAEDYLDGVVNTCSCECGCTADFIATDDGVYHLLSMTIPNPDDEVYAQYTKFAEQIGFGVPYYEVIPTHSK